MSDCVYVKGGSKKYILSARFVEQLNFKPKTTVRTEYILLTSTGLLVIEPWYEWDGPSGPAIDTDNFMDGSLVHDALYDLLRRRLLKPMIWYRLLADNEMFLQCKKDKMSLPRRCWTWLGVRIGGIFAAYRKG
jgi:hypothetical protein